MSKLKFVFFGFRNQKIKFMIVFIVTLLTMIVFNLSSSMKKSVIDTRIGQLRELTANSQILISASDGTYTAFKKEKFNEIFDASDNDYIEDYITRAYCYVSTNVSV